ncbi:MAG: hypothetical protein R2882_05785 [Gemmatimonadales bacterium]
MMPVVKGDAHKRQMLAYTVLLLPLTVFDRGLHSRARSTASPR